MISKNCMKIGLFLQFFSVGWPNFWCQRSTLVYEPWFWLILEFKQIGLWDLLLTEVLTLDFLIESKDSGLTLKLEAGLENDELVLQRWNLYRRPPSSFLAINLPLWLGPSQDKRKGEIQKLLSYPS